MMRLGVSGSTTVLASPATAAQAAVDGPSATVKSNGRWKLQISAAQPTWTVEGTGGRTDKPASDLLWSLGGDDRFSVVTTTPTDIAAGASTAGTTLPLHYRTQFTPSTDAPATYSLVVRLTLVGA